MSMIAIPAIIALIAKLFILGVVNEKNLKYKIFKVLVIVLATLNIAEILLLWQFKSEMQSLYAMKSFYVLATFAWIAVLAYVLEIAGIKDKKRFFIPACFAIVLSVLCLFTSSIVGGVKELSFSYSAVKGSLYWLWQVYVLLMAGFICLQLSQGYLKAKSHLVEIQCIYISLAFAPLILSSLIILGFMAAGFKINAAIALSVSSTLFLLIMLASEYQHKLTDIRRFIPWSNERKTSQQIMEIFSNYSRDDINYRDAVSEIERLLVLQKYDKNEGNASETAGRMGMPRSSLYSIFNRLDIESRGDQKS
jgi:Response regulator containing CheY-like receiver, AAA-type ATPase, and DNA-binding domains